MTRFVLIEAGPTPWDLEDRLVGNQSLPLTEEAAAQLTERVAGLSEPISAIYRARRNEACDQASLIVSHQFHTRPRDLDELDEVHLGLWQGLRREELRFRFEIAFQQWEQNPQSVRPPDGEPLEQAIERLNVGLRRILRRSRGVTIAIAVRPMALQVLAGLLRHEEPAGIAAHLHQTTPIETIEIPDASLQAYLS